MGPGYAADDGAALHFVGHGARPTSCARAPGKAAYRVEVRDGEVVEERDRGAVPRRGARRAGRGMTVPTIFALGGGGFTMETDTTALDDFVLDAGRPPRAAHPLPADRERRPARADRAASTRRSATAPASRRVLSLFRLGRRHAGRCATIVLSQDIVYVGGGSMRNLLAIWRVHRLDAILREAWERGIVLAGLSAGAMCWFEGGVTTSSGCPSRRRASACCPARCQRARRQRAGAPPGRLRRASATASCPPGYAADDGAGLLFRGGSLERAVSSRPQARAFRVEAVGQAIVETPILPTYLGRAAPAERPVPFDVREFRQIRYGGSHRG